MAIMIAFKSIGSLLEIWKPPPTPSLNWAYRSIEMNAYNLDLVNGCIGVSAYFGLAQFKSLNNRFYWNYLVIPADFLQKSVPHFYEKAMVFHA